MKEILMIGTGGTIASEMTPEGYAPELTSEQLLNYVPDISDFCSVTCTQVCNLDSTNITPDIWLDIAETIRRNYDRYDGFVITHGTDTMAYTAAALSYLIQDSKKPIVLTGSQQPMASPFTDAKLNLYQSVLYATDDASRDVIVVFSGKAIAGTRAHKQRTMSFNAFMSMNYPSLAYIRNDRVVRAGTGAPAESGQKKGSSPTVYGELDERVLVLKLTPELQPSIFELLKRDYDAVILETFGIGGIPDTMHDAILDWVGSGRTLVVTTQVPEEGLDLGVYEVGRAYAENPGILKGDDMTTEALVAKTMWALGQSRDPQRIRELFYREVNHDRMPR